MATQTTQANKELIREYLAASADGDLDAMAALIADDYTCTHTLMTGEEVRIGPDDFRAFMGAYQDVVSEYSHEIHELVAEDDRVMVRLTISGVHSGEFFGVEPTGNRYEVEEFNAYRIEDGEIVEQRFLMDDLQFLRQLGIDIPVEA